MLRIVAAATVEISNSDIIVCRNAAGVLNWTTASLYLVNKVKLPGASHCLRTSFEWFRTCLNWGTNFVSRRPTRLVYRLVSNPHSAFLGGVG